MSSLIDKAIQAAAEASDVILNIYARDFEVEFKADDSPLTEADQAAHEIIVAHLSQTPYPLLSEESSAVPYAQRAAWNRYWLIDPIDGTKEFIKKNGEFTVNIALIEQGQPIMGVVLLPVKNTYYIGDQQGAYKVTIGEDVPNVEAIIAALSSDRSALKHICVSGSVKERLSVVASKSHCNEQTLEFITQLEEDYGPADRVSSGSSIKLCMVAEGGAHLYPRIAPTCEWDTAAAHAVVRAAGGEVFVYNPQVDAREYVTENVVLEKVVYNKSDILNPYFIVSGLHKYNA
jgi:3'(2'), 5'-bisphosphate nucleotidase